MDGKSLNISEEKLEQLKAIFPEVFTEGKMDWEKLQLTMGEDITISDERYVLNWAGKSDAFRAIQTPTTATLAPMRDESINFDTTENIFIEGENLEVLKILQKAYYGKIKMIYIDPPYNTGNDSFVYPDKFAESREEYLKRVNDKDEDGLMIKEGLFRKNSKDSGHYHSNWLSMMYPRLFLARNLLRENGIIFVSIDDNEVHNLRLLMNEIFGEENFIASITVKGNPRGRDYGGVARMHDYILVYQKAEGTGINSLEEEGKEFPYKDQKSGFEIRELRNRNIAFNQGNRPNLYYPFYVNPKKQDENGFFEISLMVNRGWVEIYPKESQGYKTVWRWGKERSLLYLNIEIVGKAMGNGGYQIVEKYRKTSKMARSIWQDKSVNTEKGTLLVKDLFDGKKVFPFPKPVEMIMRLIEMGSDEGDIILDFFAGSATTAHALINQCIKDGKSRCFILVQYPEFTDKNEEAFKSGFFTIADIAKDRIRRTIEKIKKENPLFAEQSQDLGFKVLRLKHSNFKMWRGDGIENKEELDKQLDLLVDPVRPEAIEENMLFELMLKSGYALTSQVEKCEIGKAHYYLVEGELAIALSDLDEKVISDILGRNPQQVICLDALFGEDDPLKTNTQLQFKDAGITFHCI